ncbi:alpha/beta hydrolase [Terrihabitans soli]|uniref:Alpha/beta hydrolase n=1 Tax=Terrihabitans soli TaxID=708113 RepID=A0A6S6QPA9_9HYPH|nr:alpha/beta hydrolase [Terrihabitans soli]BCJ92404.1 alpha/beta hydrolase [Terrihabitans soli]
MEQLEHLTANGRKLALRITPGAGPATIWLGGFKSDMQSTKAQIIADWAAANGRANLRFDYSGHGESDGRFEDGTISAWLEDALAVIRAKGGEAPILVGSSMGGWLSLLAARALREEQKPLSGLVLIAPAADFTEDLMWNRFPPEIRAAIDRDGVYHHPSEYSEIPTPITRALIEDGRRHQLLGSPLKIGAPIRILQGMQDPDVPWQHVMRLVEHLAEDDVTVTMIRDGDHRLSRPEDLERLVAAVAAMARGSVSPAH